MTSDEKKELEAAIMRLIEYDFHIDFRQLYDNAVLHLHETLYQAGEETRNFLEHCGLALSADTKERAQVELARGKRHLYYGKYVCLLVPTLNGLSSLEEKVQAREIKAPVPGLRARLLSITAEYKKVHLIDEIVPSGDLAKLDSDIAAINSSNLMLERVLAEIDKFEDALDGLYFRPGLKQISVSPSLGRVVLWLYGHKKGVVIFAIAMNVIAAILYAIMFERPVRHGMNYILSHLTSHTATKAPVAPTRGAPPTTSQKSSEKTNAVTPSGASSTSPAVDSKQTTSVPIPATPKPR